MPSEAEIEAAVKAIKAVETGGFGWPGYDEERATEALAAAERVRAAEATSAIPAAPLDDYNAMTEAGQTLIDNRKGGGVDK